MIDWAQIQQLEEDVGTEDLAEVTEVFLEEVDEAIDALRGVVSLENSDMASALHFLKGSAANLGFVIFANLCSQGEQLANDGVGETVNLETIVTTYDQSKLQFMNQACDHCGLDFK
ncbi:nickel transporter [Amylibacter ulvae]|uniref:Nickel transporter n=1 Tax=Paramylibacter ulvae TaxID=1651968 RepID=A0ABQ3CZD9_9RHOB|nr:Hpt domain-containing protein [Amylibacter ulvae]GHA49205.1 nickel transporter [Amylibacter ulvae]